MLEKLKRDLRKFWWGEPREVRGLNLHLRLGKTGYENLEKLRKLTGEKGRSDVVRKALNCYDMFADEVLNQGSRVIIERPDGTWGDIEWPWQPEGDKAKTPKV